MNWNLMLQVATTIVLKLIASTLFLMYFPQIFYMPVLQEEPSAITKAASCAARWHPFEGKCYFFSTATQRWDESREICEQLGSHLAVVNSKEELEFLKSKALLEMYFIGLSRKGGRWTWIDGTEFDRNIFNLNQERGECVVVGFGDFVEPVFCSVSYRFICEKNA